MATLLPLQASRQNTRMNADPNALPNSPKNAALQQMQELLARQMQPLDRILKMQDLMPRYALDDRLTELARQFEPHQQINEILERTTAFRHFEDIIERSSLTAQVARMIESLDSTTNLVKQYERLLPPISGHQEMLEKLRDRTFGRNAWFDFARQLEQATATFQILEDARRSLDRLWPAFRDIDFSNFQADEDDEREVKRAAEALAPSAAEQESLQKVVESIVFAIQAQQKPTVRLMLWLYFRKVLEVLISGAVGAVMGYYVPVLLGESPQAAKKAVQVAARTAVGAPELLAEYRYVSAKVLIVRLNARARSLDVGRLTFGQAVRLVKKEKDFALVVWADNESGAEIRGWVFARYLGKFY